MRVKFLAAALCAAVFACPVMASPAQHNSSAAGTPGDTPQMQKPRLIVLTDMWADPDDSMSMVRLMLYANEMDIEGLIATTSVWMKTETHPEGIRSVIRAYGKARANLLLHEGGYPREDTLLSLVVTGQPGYGLAATGEGKDTAGSDRIIRALEAPDPRPLWVTAWGGTNTLAQALLRIRATHSPAQTERLVAKLRVYTISDQDDSGAWIRKNFPGLFYVFSPGPYADATWTAMNTVIPDIDNSVISNNWLRTHIQQNHGPLGAAYPDVAYGTEGDTPSFLGLIPNGLNVPDHPDYGGWGGRYERYTPQMTGPTEVTGGIPMEPETRPVWANATDTITPFVQPPYGRATVPASKSFHGFLETLWRWRDDFQNDFAARMDWTVKPYAAANHPPVPRLAHPDHLSVHSGEPILLSAMGSTDPDGDSLSYLWFQYPEAGSYKQPLTPDGATNIFRAHYTAPKVTAPQTIHFILRVTDKGSPALSRYKRVIVTVLP